jgi:hypothetical protein
VIIRYIFLATVCIGCLLSWRPAWILRGSGFLALSSILSVSDAVRVLLHTPRAWLAWGTFWIIPLSIGAVARNSWLVSADSAEVWRTLEDCARAVWLKSTRTTQGGVFGAEQALIQWRQFTARRGILTFPVKPYHKKMDLLKKLFYKKYQPLFPRLRIRLF